MKTGDANQQLNFPFGGEGPASRVATPQPSAVITQFFAGAHKFGAESTARLAMRTGEFLMWVGTDSFLAAGQIGSWKVRDYWQLREGDTVTITSRIADVPRWFELHPSDVSGAAVYWMLGRLRGGYKPSQPMAGFNIWRVKAGDRLVLFREDDSAGNKRVILNFSENVLVLGETIRSESSLGVPFGAPARNNLTLDLAEAMRTGFKAAFDLGGPSEFAEQWSLS